MFLAGRRQYTPGSIARCVLFSILYVVSTFINGVLQKEIHGFRIQGDTVATGSGQKNASYSAMISISRCHC